MSKKFSYRISQVRVPLDYTDETVLKRVSRLAKVPVKKIISTKIVRKSIDARKNPSYVLTVDISTPFLIKTLHNIKPISENSEDLSPKNIGIQKDRPVIIGAGPAGLWAAWYLAKSGVKPILVERGEKVLKRAKSVNRFWKEGILNEESNVLYGEGGAGLFSDGKLTARSKDKGRVLQFLNLLVKHGASKEILIETHPHIGSDRLLKIIPSIREEIIALGGEIRFSSKLTELTVEKNKLVSIRINDKEISCSRLILATGHSARDIYDLLEKNGISQKAKPFAVGVRLELSQDLINNSQYRCYSEKLGAASFRLTQKATDFNRACYSFCMCPGGEVISCASEKGHLTTNGMSLQNRSKEFGNAAFLIPVSPIDLQKEYGESAFAGINFQKDLEQKAYILSGNNYAIPASNLSDFLNNVTPKKELVNYSASRIKTSNVNTILPAFIKDNLHSAIPKMLNKLGSPDPDKIIIYAPETRSSSPIQISRDENGESINTKGVFPAGEGAGYAGGIVSSGVDGLKAAESVVKSYTL